MATKPRTWRTLHWRHVWVLALLVLTGMGLFLPSWRSGIGYGLPLVQDVHEIGGILYGLAIIGWSARFFPWSPQRPYPGYTRWGYFFLVGLTVTGVGLLVGPSWTHALATVGHALFSALFVVWALWHLLTRLPVVRRLRSPAASPSVSAATASPSALAEPERPTWHVNRRRFLRWGVAMAVTLPLLDALPKLLKVVGGSLVGAAAGTNDGALPGFIPYTVVAGYPNIPVDQWHLTLTRQGKSLGAWTLAELQASPTLRSVQYNFHCVTGWAVDGITVRGVDLAAWLNSHGWNPQDSPWVLFYSGDGVYTESMSAAQIHLWRPLVAWEMEGRPLPVSQGYPVRLLVPGMYGYKSIKWLTRIELTTKDQLGYWEVRGYPQNAYLGSYLGL